MRPILFGSCSRCQKGLTVPAFSLGNVTPVCGCPAKKTRKAKKSLFSEAQAAYEMFAEECRDADPRDILLRLQDFVARAGVALLQNETKDHISCLVSAGALARVLAEKGWTE